MSHLLVYATTDSRLHADLLVVRLKRAGIATGLISILYPSGLRPNSTRCWIRGSTTFPMGSADEVTVSGMLGLRLNALLARWGHRSLVDCLGEIGLSHDQSMNVEETLRGNSIVVAVEAADEADLPAIYHTLRGLAVEKVQTSDSALANRELSNLSRRNRRTYAPAEMGLSHGVPA